MSYYRITAPQKRRVTVAAVLGVLCVLVVLGLVAGWAAARPFAVTVDGLTRVVVSGTTVADLRDKGVLAAASGSLRGVDGSVLRDDGGLPPSVTLNGEPALLTQRLYAGDVISSAPGFDRTESVVVTDVPLPYQTRYEGSGPLTEMKTLGAVGVKRQTLGSISGVEVTSTVVVEPADMVIRRMRPKGKVVALTFDDGPWPGQTDQILDVLADEGVHATFFMLGKQAERNPRIAKRVADGGHDVGNHSYSHKAFDTLSAKQVTREVTAGRKAVEKASGGNAEWLRPPYGAMDDAAWRQLRNLDTNAVMWDVDSRDWTKPGYKKIRRNVLGTVRSGSVVLFHDGGGNRSQTIKALPSIIRRLKKRGYHFVTVSELYEIEAESRKKSDSTTSSLKAADGSDG